jgi:DNA-binding transcriptional ArsR family regulator
MKHLATLEQAGLVIAEREGRDKRLWLNATPIQWIHERWTSEYSAYWAARLTRLKFAAEGAEILPLTPKKKGRPHG